MSRLLSLKCFHVVRVAAADVIPALVIRPRTQHPSSVEQIRRLCCLRRVSTQSEDGDGDLYGIVSYLDPGSRCLHLNNK